MRRSTHLMARLVTGSAVIAALSLAMGTASPSAATSASPADYGVLTMVGTDVTQDVMKAFASQVTATGSDYMASGLLQRAAAVGDTTINMTFAPANGDAITIFDPYDGNGTGASNRTTNLETETVAGQPVYVDGTTTSPGYYVVTLAVPIVASHPARSIVTGAALAAGSTVLASYDAVGDAFQTKPQPSCTFIANNGGPQGNAYVGTTTSGSVQTGTTVNTTGLNGGTYLNGGRPNGPQAGAYAMGDAYSTLDPTFGCVDVARSPSKRYSVKGLGPNQAVNIPFALDSYDFAVTKVSNFPRRLSVDNLKAIYRCTYEGMIPATAVIPNFPNTTIPDVYSYAEANGMLYAQLPQAGSPTRKFFVQALGLIESATAASGFTGATCITSVTPSGDALKESDLRFLDQNGIGVTSISQSIAQQAQSEPGYVDKQGNTVLVSIDKRAEANGGTPWGDGRLSHPMTMTQQFGGGIVNTAGAMQMWREVFNVVPLQRLNDPNIQAAFVGSNSTLCGYQGQAILAEYGFALDPNCGTTTNLG